MSSFTQVTRTGCLGNFFGSLVAAFFGLGLFIGAFPLIWFGEGRTNMAQVAATSVLAPVARADAANEGQLIAVTAPIKAAPLGDPPYLRPGFYLEVRRVAEMYAWVEHEQRRTRDEVGGGTRTETTYTYQKEWTSSPKPSSNFHVSVGHSNPAMEIKSATLRADDGQIGGYNLDLQNIDLPSGERLTLSSSIVDTSGDAHLDDNYLLLGDTSLRNPQIGDERISYKIVASGQPLTVFGTQQGSQIVAYSNEKGDRLYRALKGDRAAAIQQLQTEDTIMDWAIRIGALLMMWGGLALALGPLNAAVGILPVMRQAGGCLIGLATLAVALPIWGATVMIALVLHNIWLMLAVILLIIGGAAFFLMRRQAAA